MLTFRNFSSVPLLSPNPPFYHSGLYSCECEFEVQYEWLWKEKKAAIGTNSNPNLDLGAYLNIRTSHHA